MSNEHIIKRLAGIREQLLGTYKASGASSNATRGSEREFFVDLFLSQILPLPFRFGTGDATDQIGARSGQLDVVVEYPFLPSLPIAGGSRYRLYLAESIAAVIEVKSDVSKQWDEVRRTAENLHKLTPNFGVRTTEALGGRITRGPGGTNITGMHISGPIEITGDEVKIPGVNTNVAQIPMFAFGYKSSSWKTMDTLSRKLEEGHVDCILALDPCFYVSGPRFGSLQAKGDEALWAFICSLHRATKQLTQISSDPMSYI